MALLKKIAPNFFNTRANPSENAPNMFLNCCEFIPNLPKLKTLGEYPDGVPEGLIVHYTAGNQQQSAQSAIDNALRNGHCYFYIDAAGTIYQQFDLNRYGSHAGESICPETGRKNVSKYYAGVEIACAGKLTFTDGEYYTWFGKKVPKDQVRNFNGSGWQQSAGFYQKFTIPQEQALFKLSLALIKLFNISPSCILGHDEVAQGRKQDPAGSLSCTMEDFRKELKKKITSSLVDFDLG